MSNGSSCRRRRRRPAAMRRRRSPSRSSRRSTPVSPRARWCTSRRRRSSVRRSRRAPRSCASRCRARLQEVHRPAVHGFGGLHLVRNPRVHHAGSAAQRDLPDRLRGQLRNRHESHCTGARLRQRHAAQPGRRVRHAGRRFRRRRPRLDTGSIPKIRRAAEARGRRKAARKAEVAAIDPCQAGAAEACRRSRPDRDTPRRSRRCRKNSTRSRRSRRRS
jgi:hypothetical protein